MGYEKGSRLISYRDNVQDQRLGMTSDCLSYGFSALNENATIGGNADSALKSTTT